MTNLTIENLNQIKALEAQVKALNAQIKAMKEDVKAEMKAAGIEKTEIDGIKVSYSEYVTLSLDSKAIKENQPELFDKYGVLKEQSRLTIK